MARIPLGRRAFLALSTASLLRGQAGKGAATTFPPQHFLDPATELDLYRITDPQYNSSLPAPHLRAISRRGRFLIHTSDRSGAPQVYRLDWHSGESRMLSNAQALDAATPALSPDDRWVVYFDGAALKQLTFSGMKERTLAEVAAGWQRGRGFCLSADGTVAAWVETDGERSRIQMVRTLKGAAATVITATGPLSDPQLRPAHSEISYRIGDQLHLVKLDGSGGRVLPTDAGGAPGETLWTQDGRALLYLSVPADRTQLTTLRECSGEAAGADKLIAKTSQFASFGVNGDASVFVGASRSLASPYILLLVRSARRELTLCEHRSSDPASVAPVFSPDSQSVFFTSDRKGKRAIYRVHVERFVEETGDEAGV